MPIWETHLLAHLIHHAGLARTARLQQWNRPPKVNVGIVELIVYIQSLDKVFMSNALVVISKHSVQSCCLLLPGLKGIKNYEEQED